MQLTLYFFSAPEISALKRLDSWFSEISSVVESHGSGLRLWISRLPSAQTPCFVKAQAYEIDIDNARLRDSEREAFRVAIGACPRKIMRCSALGKSTLHWRVLFELVHGVLQRCGGLLALREGELELLESTLQDRAAMKSCRLASFPGNVYELACEREDGELQIFQLVDARYFMAWYRQWVPESEKPSFDLPYSRRAAGLDF